MIIFLSFNFGAGIHDFFFSFEFYHGHMHCK